MNTRAGHSREGRPAQLGICLDSSRGWRLNDAK
jgi:hypothetical protein